MKHVVAALAVSLFAGSAFAAGEQVKVVTLNAYSDVFSVHFKEAGLGAPQFFNAKICADIPQSVQSAILVILADARKPKETLAVSTKGRGDDRCVNAAFQQTMKMLETSVNNNRQQKTGRYQECR